ncbi:LacI family DNA-binding transcriptional regulator [Devriesea agamarum]|uniref:LacI family DNA-binding transcriptional regulator n=1 Tax=Devriesea agamarum TaxID=472569 RepID=UPI000A035FE1|nr:LacI family DNA-binding transcriptional regulator [Devriesea agamarum]
MTENTNPSAEGVEPGREHLSGDAAAHADQGSESATKHSSVQHTNQIIEQGDTVARTIAEQTASGQRRATLKDVAASLGISTAVALRALRGESDITHKLVSRVHDEAERLNFPLEEVSAEEDRNGVVAVLVNTMRNTWISDLVRAIRIELSATGRSVVVVPTRRRLPEFPIAADTEAIEAVRKLGVDGFVMVSELSDIDTILDCVGSTPIVSIGGSKERTGSYDTVRIDDETGQGLIVSHLVSLGHRDIAHVGGVGSEVAKERAEAFRKAMEVHGLTDHARVEPADFTEQVGQTAGSMLLRGSSVPTAVTCVNDPAAVGVLSAARDAGYDVPSELALAGYGNTSLAASGATDITSIDPNSDRLGALAAQFLVERIGGFAEPPRDVAVAPELVIRRSTSAGPRPAAPRRQRVHID